MPSFRCVTRYKFGYGKIRSTYAAYVGSPVRNWPNVKVVKFGKKCTSEADATEAMAPPREWPVTIGLYPGNEDNCACIVDSTSFEIEFLCTRVSSSSVTQKKNDAYQAVNVPLWTFLDRVSQRRLQQLSVHTLQFEQSSVPTAFRGTSV